MASEQTMTEKSFKDFLENTPPNTNVEVVLDGTVRTYSSGKELTFTPPNILIHCSTEECSGLRFFVSGQKYELQPKQSHEYFLHYICRNCNRSIKTYAVRLYWRGLEDRKGTGLKYGEKPTFGSVIPPKLVKILGAELDYFQKGHLSENQGFGIAAFAYYRRVIVNLKNKIIDEIIKVCEKLSADNEFIESLKAAKKESRFTQSIDLIKPGLPQALFVDGHNPITLLHDAVSDGLHEGTDEECLELATTIRIVLSELIEKIASVHADKTELSEAVNKLLKRKAEKEAVKKT